MLTKERQLKKKGQDQARTEMQQKELPVHEQNRQLKEYCQSLKLRINDLEEQDKELKLKLLTSENLRTSTTE